MLQGPKGYKQVRANGYVVHQFPSSPAPLDEGKWIQELIVNNQQQVLILDVRTDLATSAIQAIRATGILIVTIDDPSDRRLLADLAFYPPVPQVGRLDWTGFTGQRFVGWDWVLLRPQFAKHAQRARARAAESMAEPPSSNRRLTLLVTMGGSDPAGLTLLALDAIEKIEGDFRTLVVIGGGFMHEAALADWLARANRSYEIRRDVTDMASLMAEVDLAVASFGVTAYELSAMGIPAIYLCLTSDHAEAAEALVAEGVALSMGDYKKTTPVDLARVLSCAIREGYSFRMLRRAVQCIDGLAAKRIASIIVSSKSADAEIALSGS